MAETGKKPGRRSRAAERRRKRSSLPAVLAVLALLLLLGGIGGGIYVEKYMPTRQMAELSEYFDVAGDNVQVYLNNEKQRTEKDYLVVGRYRDGHVYLPYDFVLDKLNERFYWDAEMTAFLYAMPTELLEVREDSTLSDGTAAFFSDGDKHYLNVDWIAEHTALSYQQYTEGEYKRIFLYNAKGEVTTAKLRRKEAVRLKGGVKSEVLTNLTADAEVTILETMDKWTKVVTPDGFIGYLRNSRLAERETVQRSYDYTEPEYTHLLSETEQKIGFWQVTNQSANSTLTSALDGTQGLTVLAPTWYALEGNDGNFRDLSTAAAVNEAHSRGLSVWATVNNFDSGEVDEEAILTKRSVREKLISSLIQSAQSVGLDGLNIDFESIPESLGRDYVEFMREMSISCRNAGLVLSVDCYVPYNYNKHYDIEELGKYCDYVIIMCYDEHYAGSETAGSVASISYVDRGIEEATAVIPKEQVIIALPFYTRVWITAADGSLRSEAMGIAAAQNWISQKGVSLSWDESIGQNYGSIEDEDGRKEIWMEDAESLTLKLKHVREAGAGGTAYWKLGQEPAEIWSVLNGTAEETGDDAQG